MSWKKKRRGSVARARRRRRRWEQLCTLAKPDTMEQFVLAFVQWVHAPPIEPWFALALANKLGDEVRNRLREAKRNPRIDGPRWRCDEGHEVRGYPWCHLCRFDISPARPPDGESPKEAAGSQSME